MSKFGGIPVDEPTTSKFGGVPVEDSGFIDTAIGAAVDIYDAGKDWASEAWTGDSRQTRATQELPELWESGLLSDQDWTQVAALSPAMLTATDPAEIAQIITSNFPHINQLSDEKGNIYLSNGFNGVRAMVNKPGFSLMDGLQMAGLAAEYTPAAKLGSGATSIIGKMTKVGAGTGATEALNQTVQSASGGEFNTGDVAVATFGGALFEGAFSGLARYYPVFRERIEKAGGQLTDDIRQTFKAKAKLEGIPENQVTDDVIMAEIKKGSDDFGVELTQGQTTGNQKQLRLEDDMLTGRAGDEAQDVMIAHRNKVNQQITDASDDVQMGLGGDRIESKAQAGGIIKEGIRDAERIADDAVGEAYEAVGDAALSPEGFVGLFQGMRNSIRDRVKFPRIETASGTPGTKALESRISETIKFFKRNGVRLKTQHIKRLEVVRKSIKGYIDTAANSTDRRNMMEIRNAFDQYLDDAVKKGLMEGDTEALNALKSARGLFKEYAQKFRPQPTKTKGGRTLPDRAGNFIDDIISADPSDTQVVNSLFGSGQAFGKDVSLAMVKRFKQILGDGDGWNAVRQAAFKRLLKTDGKNVIDPSRTLTSFNKALNDSPELMKEIFTSQEISTMAKFFTHIQRTRTDIIRGRVNPSGSGTLVIEEAKKQLSRLMDMIGFASGNPVLAFSGSILRSTGKAGARDAIEATRPFSVVNANPAIVGVTASVPMVASD